MISIGIKSSAFREGRSIIKANYYLNDGRLRLYNLQESGVPCMKLRDVVSRIHRPGIFKRIFIDNAENGYPYITAADMMKTNPLDSAKIISKKFTPNVSEMKLRDKEILVSCAGTVGNIRLITKDLDGIIGSQDIIRVVPNKEIPYGFIYAYLTSPTIYSCLQSLVYGSVVPRLDPFDLGDLPIPLLPEPQQQHIHNLIEKAALLREEANQLLREAIELLENKLPEIHHKNIYISKISDLIDNSNRIEATTNVEGILAFYKEVSHFAELKMIAELSKKVFTPPIFKRQRVNNPIHGVPFLSGSDLLTLKNSFNSYLSKTMKNIDLYKLKEGWITIQDAGTIGYVSLLSKNFDGVTATNNLVRIVPDYLNNNNYYIFAFLKTKQGQKILKSFEYGSVQKHIDNYQVSGMKVPIIADLYEEITNLVSTYLSKLSTSSTLENQAIIELENTITSWQN